MLAQGRWLLRKELRPSAFTLLGFLNAKKLLAWHRANLQTLGQCLACWMRISVTPGANIVAEQVKLPPVVPAPHMGTGSSPGFFTSNAAPH